MERQSRSAWHGTLLVLGAASLWGLWPVWVRGEAPGSVVAVIAQLVGGLVALPLALARARSRPPLPRAAWVAVLLVGGCNAANTLLYFRGLDEGHVAPVALAHYLAPVLVALLAPRILGEVRSPRTPWALVLALGGTALLLASGHGLDRPGALAAAGMGAGSAVFYASATLIARKISDQIGGVELFAYQALVAALVTLPVVELPALGPAWILPATGGVISCCIAGVAFYAGLARLPAERAGVLAYWEVVAATLVGWVAFAEVPGWGALVGGLGILAAGWLVVTAPGRPR
jgi:DME family drug/metabolite transporter